MRSIRIRTDRRGSRASRPLALLVALAIAIAGLLACATAERPSALPDDINAVFLDEELDVGAWVERFEGESRDVYAHRFDIVSALDLTPGDRVADIGAGTGFFAFLFAEAVGRTGRVDAVEISPRFLEHLAAEKAARGIGNLRVVEGSERSVELPRASIDLAFICDVYHHFEYPMDSLASLHEAIRPGGALVLIEFHRIPGKTPERLLEHVRAGREVFQAEIEAAGFRLDRELEIDGLDDNYVLRFVRVD